MAQKSIGQILVGLGRITEDDIDQALAYQKEHGGYFGEALVACGLVTEEELEFGLASQADLPYVFPDADAADPEAASLVTQEWALENLTIPILQAGDRLTVIVDSPMRTDAVEQLREETGLEIDLALASPANIRDLVRQVFARGAAAEEEPVGPVELGDAVDELLADGALRFGLSARGDAALVWWDAHGTIRRRPLDGDWRRAFDGMLNPTPTAHTAGKTRERWDGRLTRAGSVTPVEASFLSDESGFEYLFVPGETESSVEERFPEPPEGVVSEVRMLARSGEARMIVTTEPEALGHEILPHLPALLIDPAWRTIYLHARERNAADESFSVAMPDDAAGWSDELESLRGFRFDAVTVDLVGDGDHWVESVLDVASVAFVLWQEGQDHGAASAAGIRTRLHITRGDDGVQWSLHPVDAT